MPWRLNLGGNDAFRVIGNVGGAEIREFILQQILVIKSQNTVICVARKRPKDAPTDQEVRFESRRRRARVKMRLWLGPCPGPR